MSDTTTSGPDPRDRVTLRPQGLQGLLALVPYLVGFHPEQSLVVVLIDQRRVCLSMRIDIDAFLDHPAHAVRVIDEQIVRLGATQAVLIAYTPHTDPAVMPALTGLGWELELAALARDHQLVIEVVQVAGDRYWSLACAEPSCCAGEGHDYRAVLDDPVAAEAVLHGLSARASRDDLRALITPGSQPGDQAYQDLITATASEIAGWSSPVAAQAMEDYLGEIEHTQQAPDELRLAELTGLLVHPAARDVATLRIERATAAWWSQIWATAARQTTGRYAVGPLALVGLAAWTRGDGALVNLCVDEADQINPDHGLIRILRDVADRGLHPDTWPQLRQLALTDPGTA